MHVNVNVLSISSVQNVPDLFHKYIFMKKIINE